MKEDSDWDGFIVNDLSNDPPSPEEFLASGQEGYVGTPMEDAEAALELLQEKVQPILVKLEEAADPEHKGSGAAWIKNQEARLLLEWIITILNHSQILQIQIEAATTVMGQMDAEIKRLNDGKGLWTPGTEAPEFSAP